MTSNNPRWSNEDRPRKAEAIWQTLLHFCGPDIAQGRWVDLGCGSGSIAAYLAAKVSDFVGIDPEPWAQWSDLMREQNNLTLLQGSYDSQPGLIPTESADVVICNQVYEHVPDPVALIQFIHRSLKPGGYCYFAGPNLLFPIEPHVFWPFVHWLPRWFAARLMLALGSKALLDANSIHYWKLCRLLNQFETQNAVPFIIGHPETYFRTSIFWRLLSKIPTSLLHLLNPLTPTFVYVLRKPLSIP